MINLETTPQNDNVGDNTPVIEVEEELFAFKIEPGVGHSCGCTCPCRDRIDLPWEKSGSAPFGVDDGVGSAYGGTIGDGTTGFSMIDDFDGVIS